MLLDRAQQLGAGALDPIRFGNALFDTQSRLPEALDDRLADRADVHDVTRLQWPDLFENRSRRQRVAEAEEVVDAVPVEVEAVVRQVAQRRDFRGERKSASLLGEKQRLDAE